MVKLIRHVLHVPLPPLHNVMEQPTKLEHVWWPCSERGNGSQEREQRRRNCKRSRLCLLPEPGAMILPQASVFAYPSAHGHYKWFSPHLHKTLPSHLC